MDKLKIIGGALLLSVLGLTLAGCGAGEEVSDAGAVQTAPVTRGDLVVNITAAGNLVLSLEEGLTFEISGTEQDPLTVAEVIVDEGDAVTEGQILVTLDASAIEEKIKTRGEAVRTAELSLLGAQIDLDKAIADGASNTSNAEIDLSKAISDGVSNISNAEVDLEKITDTYRKIIYPYTYSTLTLDAPEASGRIRIARETLAHASLKLKQAVPSQEKVYVDSETNDEAVKLNSGLYGEILADLKAAADELVTASFTLDPGNGAGLLEANMLTVSGYWSLKSAEQSLMKSQTALDRAIATANTSVAKLRTTLQKVVATAGTSVEKARITVARTGDTLAQAEDNLAEAQEELEKVEITAPFDGFVMQVNVAGGDAVKKGTVAVRVADPDRFEANVLVNEMDIAQLKMGGTALVTVDSITGLSLPATITHLSPRANVQSGVVNYQVKVELASLEAAAPERPERAAGREPPAPGEMPDRIKQAVADGRMTQAQADALLQRIQEGGGQFGQGGQDGGPGGQFGQGGQRPPAPGGGSPQPQVTTGGDIQLRQGLSVTITLKVDEAKDVILVPNAAITRRGGDAFVLVVTADGTTAERPATVGISNWTHTEVTAGLEAGEKIVVSQPSAAASSADSSGRSSSPTASFGRLFR